MPLIKWQPPALRHSIDEDGRVTWLELFFDLIYVAALIQLGDELASDVTWPGVVRFVGVFVVLWWTWTGTTAFMNRFAVDDVWHRLLTFAQMFAVGNFAIVAVGAVDDRSTWLAVSFLVARLPLLLMYVRVRRALPAARDLADFYLIGFGAGAALWAGSLLTPTPLRYWLWGLGLVAEFVIPLLAGRRFLGPPAHEEHFRERYALFTIIVLGETFVKTLTEVNEIGISIQTQVFGMLGFAILIALWWTYFDDVAESNIRRRSMVTSNPIANRIVWVYTHLPLTLGLTAFGVAAKKVIAVEAFDDALKNTYSWLLAGAVIAVLVAVAVLDMVTVSPHYAVDGMARVVPRLVAAAGVLLGGWLLATGGTNALIGVTLVTAVAVGQIAVEVLLAARAERALESEIGAQLSARVGACHDIERFGAYPVIDERVCEICVEHDQRWVQLRVCLTCGYVGCCDDTPGHHARTHYEETGHRVIATAENGGSWAYCYVHETTDDTWVDRHRSPVAEA